MNIKPEIALFGLRRYVPANPEDLKKNTFVSQLIISNGMRYFNAEIKSTLVI
jgi:hypothetical protein